VKVIGVFPDNTDDPIIYPVALRANTKPDAVRYFSFLRTQTAKSVFARLMPTSVRASPRAVWVLLEIFRRGESEIA
jgi:hypothetical protein